MTEEDLADRLGKAKVVQADCPHFFQNDEGPGWSCDEDHNGGHCLCRDWIREIDELASLRRSAPASADAQEAVARAILRVWCKVEESDMTFEELRTASTDTSLPKLSRMYSTLIAESDAAIAAVRSAPASGEMREAQVLDAIRNPTPESLDAALSVTATFRDIKGSGLTINREKMRMRLQAFAAHVLRTPSGETREEAGS